MRDLRTIWICLAVKLLAACSREPEAPETPAGAGTGSRTATIYTVNYPLAWVAEQLLEGAVEVRFSAPVDVDPAFWQPDLDTVAAYQRADLILLNGANYARLLARVSLPDNRLVDTARSFAEQLIPVDSGPVHSHGPAGDHSHGELAFTVWLDLDLYAQQTQAVAASLAAFLPERAEAIASAADTLSGRLLAMDGELIELGRQLDGGPVLYSHPVYQYFGRRYGLNGRSFHWEPGQSPGQKDWAALSALLEQHPAILMLWEDEPLPATRDRLGQLGVEVVVYRTLGNRPLSGDFGSEMAANISRLRTAVEQVP